MGQTLTLSTHLKHEILIWEIITRIEKSTVKE